MPTPDAGARPDGGGTETDGGVEPEPDGGVEPPPAFTLQAASELTVRFSPDASVAFPVQVVLAPSFGEAVTLTVEGLPAHVQAASATAQGSPGALIVTEVAFTVGELATYGSTPVKLVGEGGGERVELALTLDVQPGRAALDTSFGSSGLGLPDLGHPAVSINAMAVQPDGKWILVGSTGSTGLRDVLVARLLADGTPDTTFGTGGAVVTDICSADDFVDAVTVLADGRILVAGGAISGAGGCAGTQYQSALFVRYTSTGALDTTFGGTGVRAFQLSTGVSTLRSVTVDSQGRIVGTGTVKNTDLDLLVLRLTPTGALDTTFSADGLAWLDLGGDDDGLVVTTLSDGKAVVAGTSTDSVNGLALVRFNANGTRDTAFSYSPVTARPTMTPRTLHVLSDGKLLVGARGVFNADGSESAATLARFTSTGAADTSYSLNGTYSFSAVLNQARDTLVGTGLLANGEVAIATWSKDATGASAVGVVHASADGRTVLRRHRTDLPGDEKPRAALLDADGVLRVAGLRTAPGGTVEAPFVTRFWPY